MNIYYAPRKSAWTCMLKLAHCLLIVCQHLSGVRIPLVMYCKPRATPSPPTSPPPSPLSLRWMSARRHQLTNANLHSFSALMLCVCAWLAVPNVWPRRLFVARSVPWPCVALLGTMDGRPQYGVCGTNVRHVDGACDRANCFN